MEFPEYQPQSPSTEWRRGGAERRRGGAAGRGAGGGGALGVGEEGKRAGAHAGVVVPAANGVRTVDIRADKVSTANILLALRLKDLTYSANLPLTGELKGELGRDGLPTYFRGKITAGAGSGIERDTRDC